MFKFEYIVIFSTTQILIVYITKYYILFFTFADLDDPGQPHQDREEGDMDLGGSSSRPDPDAGVNIFNFKFYYLKFY